MLITNQTNEAYWFGPMYLSAGVGSTLTIDDTTDTGLYLIDDEVAEAVNTLALAADPTLITVTPGTNSPYPRPTGTPDVLHGSGSPNGIVYAPQGSLYLRKDSTQPATGTYTKTTGVTENTGWYSSLVSPMQQIQQFLLNSPAANITFGPIPQIYTNLMLLISAGSDQTAAQNLYCNNGQTNPYYYYETMQASSGSVGASDTYGDTQALIGTIPNVTNGFFGATQTTFMGYTNSSMVPYISIGGSLDGASALANVFAGVIDTAQQGGSIANLLVYPAAGYFVAGSAFTLYGL